MQSSENVKAGRPGAASGKADEESGSEGLSASADVEKDLFALKVMRDRGLMDEESYRKRVEAVTGRQPKSD